MIVPILCYGSEIWGFELAKQIEVVQDRFCKTLLKVPNYTSSITARGQCGRLPLCFIYFTRCIKYWLKLIRMEEFRYPKQCYLMLKRLDECNRITWATKVRYFYVGMALAMSGFHKERGIQTVLLEYLKKG